MCIARVELARSPGKAGQPRGGVRKPAPRMATTTPAVGSGDEVLERSFAGCFDTAAFGARTSRAWNNLGRMHFLILLELHVACIAFGLTVALTRVASSFATKPEILTRKRTATISLLHHRLLGVPYES
jgi:hypothetical protein